jgi:hypothetical protein
VPQQLWADDDDTFAYKVLDVFVLFFLVLNVLSLISLHLKNYCYIAFSFIS